MTYHSYVELTQTMTSAHDILYPSKDRTIALVRVGEYYKYVYWALGRRCRSHIIISCHPDILMHLHGVSQFNIFILHTDSPPCIFRYRECEFDLGTR